MTKLMRFVGRVTISELMRVYRDKYAGNEADIRFAPLEESTISLDIHIHVPHLVADGGEFEKRFEAAANRALRQMERECAIIADELQAKVS